VVGWGVGSHPGSLWERPASFGAALTVAVADVEGRRVAVSGGLDGRVRLWDPATGKQVGALSFGAAVQALAVTDLEGRPHVVVGTGRGRVEVLDVESGRQVAMFEGERSGVDAVAVGRIGDQVRLVEGGNSGRLRVWDPVTGERVGDLAGHRHAIWALAFSDTSWERPHLASSAQNGTVYLWDLVTGARVAEYPGFTQSQQAESLALATLDGRSLLFTGGGPRGLLRVFDARSTIEIASVAGHRGVVRAMAVAEAEGGLDVVTAGEDATVKVWAFGTTGLTCVATLVGHARAVAAVGLAGDAEHAQAVSAGLEGDVRVWDLGRSLGNRGRADARPGAVLRGHVTPVSGLAVGELAGRRYLATGGDDGVVRTWDVATGDCLAEMVGHRHGVDGIACIGDRILSCGTGATQLWDAATGQHIRALPGVIGTMRTVAAGTVAGRDLVAAGGTDSRVHVWDAATGDIVHDLPGHNEVRAISFATIDGQDRLLVADRYDVHIWPFDGRRGTRLAGRPQLVEALTVVGIDGHDHVITARSVGLEAWRPEGTTPAIATDLGGGYSPNSLTTTHLDGHDHVVVMIKRRVHLWRPVPGADPQPTQPLPHLAGHAILFGQQLAWINYGTVGVNNLVPSPGTS